MPMNEDTIQLPVDEAYARGIGQMGQGNRVSAAGWIDALAHLLSGAVLSRGGMGDPASGVLERLITLYRGQRAQPVISTLPDWVRSAGMQEPGYQPTAGRWFTDSPKVAQWYVDDAGGGRIVQVAVPESVAQASRLSRMKQIIPELRTAAPNEEFLLPPIWAQRAP